MFANSLHDSDLNDHSRRWTTLASFALQALAVGGLLALPFLSTQSFQGLRFVTHLTVPASRAAAPVQATARASGASTSHSVFIYSDHIRASASEPEQAEMGPPNLPIGPMGTGDATSPIGAIGDAPMPVLRQIPVVRRPIVSHMMEGNLIHRVQPQYPAIAKLAGIQGDVLLHAVIGRDGAIENLQVVSGPPALVSAARDAVRQWQYRPYMLNGEPVEVETQVTVKFVLAGR